MENLVIIRAWDNTILISRIIIKHEEKLVRVIMYYACVCVPVTVGQVDLTDGDGGATS